MKPSLNGLSISKIVSRITVFRMRPWQHRFISTCLALGVSTITLFGGTEADPKRAEELRPREGLPNFFAHIAVGKEVRVAFLGGSITIRFQGTKLGLIDIPAIEGTTLTAQIDGALPITIERKETYRKDQGMCRPFFLPTLTPGQHTVRIEVKDLPAGVSWYVGPLLVVGTITGK